MVERRESVTLSFIADDYVRLKRYGRAVGLLSAISAIVGVLLIVDLVRHVTELASRPPGSVVLTAFVILVWLGLAMFSSLVSRDAKDATDTHVVLEVGAALAVGFAVIVAQTLDLIGGFAIISADSWTMVSFVVAWFVGYWMYRSLAEHLRGVFKLERQLSPPPRWLIIIFAITIWLACTTVLADIVSSAFPNKWNEGGQRFLVLLPPIPIAVASYWFPANRFHKNPPPQVTPSGS